LSHFDTIPKRFLTLSKKLAAALQKIATGELGRKISQIAEDYLKRGRSVPGLVLLRVIQMDYSTNRQAEVVFNLNDLQKVQIKSGNLEGFTNSWDMVLKGMRKVPEEDILEFLFYEAVKGWRGIAEDVSHYERLEEGSGGERSYQFLRNAVDRYIRREKQKKVREDIGKAIGGGKIEKVAPAPKGGKGGKGDGKGKDKGKNQSAAQQRSSSAPPAPGSVEKYDRPCRFP